MTRDTRRRDSGNAAKRGRRRPAPLTRERLEKAALYYLGRYAAPVAHFRRVLLRRVARSVRLHGTDYEEGAAQVEELIARFLRAGLLDDLAYAAARASSMRRRGASGLAIGKALRAKGVAAETIEQALAASGESVTEAEWRAAAALARRRRRLGPYRQEAARADNRRRDLAILARAGFSYPLARAVIDAATPAALEADPQTDSN